MRAYLIKRLLLMFFTLWGITLISFFILQMAPGSPLEMKISKGPGGILGEQSHITEEAMEMMKKQYHLDKPIIVRYGIWLKDIVTLNFGISFTDRKPVLEKIGEALPVSLILGITSILFSWIIGLSLGLLQGGFPSSLFDRVSTFFVIAMFSTPSFVLGLYLLTFLGGGQYLDLFPIYGLQSDIYESLSWFGKISDRAYHLFLPCLCYSIGGLAIISQQQRASILDVLHQDYVRTARAKGVSEYSIYMKHAFRNSLIPIVTMFAGMLPAIIGGSVIIETLFSIPGLGRLMWQALLERDYPTIMANFTIGATLSLFGILLSDLCYVFVDPRIDFEGR